MMKFYSLPTSLYDVIISKDLMGKWYVKKRVKQNGVLKTTSKCFNSKEQMLKTLEKELLKYE